jgi:phage shock protein C
MVQEKKKKRLYKSQKDKIIFGVCGGLGKYFDQDPTIIRVITVLLVIFTGVVPGLIAYLILGMIIPINSQE